MLERPLPKPPSRPKSIPGPDPGSAYDAARPAAEAHFLNGSHDHDDEVFVTATLIQTGKIERFPIIAMGTAFWSRIQGFRDFALEEGTISPDEPSLFQATDDVDEALRIIEGTYG
ncbi:MAG: LOG family protein [Planctomycetota bacterium]